MFKLNSFACLIRFCASAPNEASPSTLAPDEEAVELRREVLRPERMAGDPGRLPAV